jgi:hypothetical protein
VKPCAPAMAYQLEIINGGCLGSPPDLPEVGLEASTEPVAGTELGPSKRSTAS